MCEHYNYCGLVAWRQENPGLAKPLEENGFCGVDPENCGRILAEKGHPLVGKQISVKDYGPVTHGEFQFLEGVTKF